jgi:Protein of unknown function (DUF2690)
MPIRIGRKIPNAIILLMATFSMLLVGFGTPAQATTLRFFYNIDIPVTSVAGIPIHGGANDAFQALHTCFNCSFPVPGAPTAYPSNGQYLPLKPCLAAPIGCLPAPVNAYDHEQQGYLLFIAAAGHFDGAGSTVQFNFRSDSSGNLHLNVVAYVASNPSTAFPPDPVNKAFASSTWSDFARNLGDFMFKYTCPYGSCTSGKQVGCSGYSCDNSDPNLSWDLGSGAPCSTSATTVTSLAADGGTLEMRWGPRCQVNWARFTPGGNGTTYFIWVGRQSPGYNTPGYEFQGAANVGFWSNQVYAPGQAQACVLQWLGSSWGNQVCTPWD